MIIKKKYANIKKFSTEEDVVENLEDVSVPQVEEVADEVAAVPEEPVQDENSVEDFDALISNIKFEQRAERRDGARRRGYRRTQDRNIVSRAQSEAVEIKETAKIEGYNDGLKKAKEDIQALKNQIAEFYHYKEELYAKISGCILDISVEIAQKIIKKEIDRTPETTMLIIKSALERINKTENKIILRVMPKDVEIVREGIPTIFSDNSFDAKITVVPDNAITEGGVVIETSNGIIDASIQTQLSIMQKALTNKEEG